jgi:hypothetical protein
MPRHAGRENGSGTGRRILRGVAVATTVGGFAVDWNRTHLFNPSWPPHAKFHDAMTISLGALLGGTALWFLRGDASNDQPGDGRTERGDSTRADLALGALLPALFWTAQGSAFLYPGGAAGLQAEFPDLVPRVRGVWIDERFAAGTALALSCTGYVLARRTT